jgi:hypothetical protein
MFTTSICRPLPRNSKPRVRRDSDREREKGRQGTTTTTEVHSEGFQECPHRKAKEGNKQQERGLFTREVPNPNAVSPRFPHHHHRPSPPPTGHTESSVPIGQHPGPWASTVQTHNGWILLFQWPMWFSKL